MTAEPSTVLELARRRAAEHPERRYVFLQGTDLAETSLTLADLDLRARAIATALQERGLRGERALLIYPPGLEVLAAFFGCLYAGVVAVPLPAPSSERDRRMVLRLQSAARSARPAVALTLSGLAPAVSALLPAAGGPACLATDGVDPGLAESWRHPGTRAGDLAYLQYTSGSTAEPRGVMVSHANLLANSELLRRGFRFEPGSVAVWWTPYFHDDGLILGLLQPLYTGYPVFLMPPATVVQRPDLWLRAISRHGATHAGGPDFIYAHAARKVRPEQREGLDLGRWAVAYDAAETVRAETLDRFTAVFGPHGFRRGAFLPAFGLAEATLVVTARRAVDPEPVERELDRAALEELRAVEARGAAARRLVGSGHPLLDTRVAIVDAAAGTLRADGEIGEVWVRNACVAQGYWGLPEESERTFRARLADGDGPFLRTGDLGFLLAGELFVTGRMKDLIILRGRNIAPQDLETAAEGSHPALRPGCTAAFSLEIGGEERAALVQEVQTDPPPAGGEIVQAICRAVAERQEVQLQEVVLIRPGTLPKTSSGKIQRAACRADLLAGRLDVVASWRLGDVPAAPRETAGGGRTREIREWLARWLAREIGLDESRVDPAAPLATLGLDSVTGLRLAHDLAEWLGRPVEPTLPWDRPTIDAIARHLAGETPPGPARAALPAEPRREPVAIVGLGCRFPGAEGPDAFWRLLREGVDAVTEVPAERWDLEAWYDANPARPGRMSTRWGGFLSGVDQFDARFFGLSPREAAQMDPQQRLVLETAWEALEDAGIAPESLAGSRTGVFVGVTMDDYRRMQLRSLDRVDGSVATGTLFSVVANRLSYLLDLHGPSLAVDTACSSSLVAVHLACQSLRSGEAEVALAGGVNLILAPEANVEATKMGVLAADGRCKAFDERADGYVRSEGVGLVVLKPLSRALADGDTVHAVIRGSAVNHDGRSNGLMAPSRQAQEAVLREAYERAGVSPGEVRYVEAHGSGTRLGDSIEARALGAVLAAGRPPGRECRVGSVKTNIGHAESAAGAAGLIKTVLALRHGEIPPSLHFATPSPLIPFAELGLRVPTRVEPWPAEGPALAGVSAFGFGGTNAHVVLEAAPRPEPPPAPESAGPHLLAISARTPPALDAATRRLAERLRSAPGLDLAAVAETLRRGRNGFDHRRFLVCRGPEEAAAALEPLDPRRVLTFTRRSGEPSPAFLFPGLGDHYEGMGRGLYESLPVFRRTIDRCAEILAASGLDLLPALYSAGPSAGKARAAGAGPDLRAMLRRTAPEGGALNRTSVAHPALFAVEYALAQTLIAAGLRPRALLGYSLGEYVAATLAGVFSLEDGLTLVAERARLVEALPAGAMLAVPLPEAEVQPLLGGELWLAIANGPELCVVGGPPGAVEELEGRLADRGVVCGRVGAGQAFHTPMMEPAAAELARLAGRFRLSPPLIPFLSNLTGTWAGEEVARPDYWARQLCRTVRFGAALGELLADSGRILLEAGPGGSLTSFAKQHPGRGPEDPVPAFATLRAGFDRQADVEVLLGALGRAWGVGLPVAWEGLQEGGRQPRVSLPTYPFERQRYWLEPSGSAPPEPAAGRLADPADWFYLPAWRQSMPPAASAAGPESLSLLLLDDLGLGAAVAGRWIAEGRRVVTVPSGEIRDREGYRRLLARLGEAPRRIVHLGSVTPPGEAEGAGRFAPAQELGFYSLLFLAQALAEEGITEPVDLWAVSSGLQRVTGGEALRPEKATLLAACRCIPQEYLNVTCRSLDVEPPVAEGLAARLAAELAGSPRDLEIAYRGTDRWVLGYDRVRLEAGRAPRLRERGVYLITGGFGEIGLTLAHALAREVRARLVLVGRSALDGGRLQEVRKLEEAGAEVLALAADVADEAQMRAVLAAVDARFGDLHGVIHAAGLVTQDSLRGLGGLDRAGCEQHFHAKVYGSCVLAALLAGRPLDFGLLMSSISTVLGGQGFAGYAAANLFLDALAHRLHQERPGVWLSVDWDSWRFDREGAHQAGTGATNAALVMSPDEGVEVFRRVLALDGAPRIVNSLGDLEARIDQWVRLAAARAGAAGEEGGAPARQDRPDLGTPYAPPATEAERALCELWQETLGVGRVGIHDNFFELGGHSLLAARLFARLREELGVDLALGSLSEAATPAELARLVEVRSWLARGSQAPAGPAGMAPAVWIEGEL